MDNEIDNLRYCLAMADCHKEPWPTTIARAKSYMAFLGGKEINSNVSTEDNLELLPNDGKFTWPYSQNKWENCVRAEKIRKKNAVFDGIRVSANLRNSLISAYGEDPLNTWKEVLEEGTAALAGRSNLGAHSLCEITLRLMEMGFIS